MLNNTFKRAEHTNSRLPKALLYYKNTWTLQFNRTERNLVISENSLHRTELLTHENTCNTVKT